MNQGASYLQAERRISLYPAVSISIRKKSRNFCTALKEVEEVMVVGVQDDLLGEVPIAFLKVVDECLII